MSYRYCPQCAAELEHREIGGALRQACPACDFVFWNNPTPVVAVIVETADGVVLARNAAWPEGLFSVITGFLEANEQPEECAIREVKEELNLDAGPASFVGYYPLYRRNQLILAFHVEASGELRLNEELIDYKLIPVDKLKGWDSVTGQAVWDWLARRGQQADSADTTPR